MRLDFVFSNDGRALVWRERGQRYHEEHVVEHDNYGGGSIMIWGGISIEGRTDFCTFPRGVSLQ